ncbi:methionine synthase II (cobalamin-independent) [Hamadaea flava]|uniref:Methionine synthase n=1 Tax=Hamadaea flava TaxID=1742688 RepID=A0ABV8LY51_9ACTN|nr:methionine synthase [Hamadaea flava]MCP2327449.1 methionine synthase II (cobalamin-independent) [Hamadaea flava]
MIELPRGSATGIGSLPGSDLVEAVKYSLGELPVAYLPELPNRGPGAELIGRGAGLLVGLPVELYTGRWRIASRGGRDLRRTHDLLERDLDQLTEQADGFAGPLKVQAAGPWTLAASIELALGQAVLSDHGAARDLSESLAEGLRLHVADMRRRVPGAQVILQLDEPSLPAVLAGQVRTASGLHTYRSVAESVAREALTRVIEAADAPVVLHCCAPDAPLALFRQAGAAGVALDLDQVKQLDPVGELIDAGLTLFAGAAATRGTRAPSSAAVADKVRTTWRTLGFSESQLPEQVVVTPACGLAGATPAYAREVLAACREAGRRLAEV